MYRCITVEVDEVKIEVKTFFFFEFLIKKSFRCEFLLGVRLYKKHKQNCRESEGDEEYYVENFVSLVD